MLIFRVFRFLWPRLSPPSSFWLSTVRPICFRYRPRRPSAEVGLRSWVSGRYFRRYRFPRFRICTRNQQPARNRVRIAYICRWPLNSWPSGESAYSAQLINQDSTPMGVVPNSHSRRTVILARRPRRSNDVRAKNRFYRSDCARIAGQVTNSVYIRILKLLLIINQTKKRAIGEPCRSISMSLRWISPWRSSMSHFMRSRNSFAAFAFSDGSVLKCDGDAFLRWGMDAIDPRSNRCCKMGNPAECR